VDARMNFTTLAAGSCWAAVLLLSISGPAFAQECAIDLRNWGYMPRPNYQPVFQEYSPTVSAGQDGGVVIGFVTHDNTGLATRAHPPFSLHIIRFSSEGSFIDQHVIPSSSWEENGLFLTAEGNLLVRAGDKLRLFSKSMTLLTERELTPTKDSPIKSWEIFPLPDRSAFLLYNFRRAETSIEILNSADLVQIKGCHYSPHQSIYSVSKRFILSWLPSPSNDGALRTITISQPCGSIQYQVTWHGDPLGASLVGDDGLILAGTSPEVEFRTLEGARVLWKASFDKRHDEATDHVEASADGRILVVAVKTFAGGNRFLDISSHLRSERLVVYKSSNGERIKEVRVNPQAPSVFGFSLAPDGHILAIVADGTATIIRLE